MPMIANFSSSIPGGVFYLGAEGEVGESPGDGELHPLLEVWPALIIINVENGGLGETRIRIASTAVDDPVGPAIFDGSLHIAGGRLRIGDATDETVIWVSVPPGDLRIRLHVSDADQGVHRGRKWWLDGYLPNRLDIVLP